MGFVGKRGTGGREGGCMCKALNLPAASLEPVLGTLDSALIATIDWYLRAGHRAECRPRHDSDYTCHVVRGDFCLEQIATLVLVDCEPVRSSSRLEHILGPDSGVEHGVWVHSVDTHTMGRELEGRDASKLSERRFRA